MLFLENLQIMSMLYCHCLAKSISNVGWNQFIKYTVHKAETANRIAVWIEKLLFY